MVSPEYVFGGNGIKQRPEYTALKAETLRRTAHEATETIEAAMDRAYRLDPALFTGEHDAASTLRLGQLSFIEMEAPDDVVWRFNEEEGTIFYEEPLTKSYEKSVSISHEKHAGGMLQDTYYIAFEQKLPYTEGVFLTSFLFESFVGGSVSAIVTSNNIDVDDDVPGEFYERPLTAYDMTVFEKEIKALHMHLEAMYLEQNIDLYLSNPIQ